MHMEPAAQVEGGVPGMGVLIDNRPHRARAGAARKLAAPSPWLSTGGKHLVAMVSEVLLSVPCVETMAAAGPRRRPKRAGATSRM